MPLPDTEYINHMLEECRFLLMLHVSGPTALEDDPLVSRAVVRSLEIIGEASRQLSEPTKQALPEIPWRMISGMRNRLIHEYFGVDYDIVFSVVQDEIPALTKALEQYLKEII
ncbi:MAG: hypothetical protein KIPDCIKN_02458 [Haliscomenobacter sp.]|jgi:uncharacterized protein with HEPN domain|nr:hypothetical protein [Haliscomenobacter sp.]